MADIFQKNEKYGRVICETENQTWKIRYLYLDEDKEVKKNGKRNLENLLLEEGHCPYFLRNSHQMLEKGK